MGGFSQTVRKALLDHYFGKATLTPPTIYVGLSTTTPTSSGDNVTEPSTGGYARKATAASDWAAATTADPSLTTNVNAITFTAASGTWSSGSNMTHAVLYDAATAGNFIGFGALSVAKPVTFGDTANIPVGDLDITLAGV